MQDSIEVQEPGGLRPPTVLVVVYLERTQCVARLETLPARTLGSWCSEGHGAGVYPKPMELLRSHTVLL